MAALGGKQTLAPNRACLHRMPVGEIPLGGAHELHPSLGHSLSVSGLEVGRLHLAALVLLDIVGDALVFPQRTHSRALDVGDVDKGVGSATFRLDEAEAFGLVEKLD